LLRSRLVYQKMSRRFLLTRFIRYYRRRGVGSTIRRAFEKTGELLSQKPEILLFVDLVTRGRKRCILPDNFTIDCLGSKEEISRQDLNALFEHVGEKIVSYHMKERFRKGACLWLVKVDGSPAGYIWSVNGRTIRPHYFPLADKDVHLFDNFIFEELRGRRINPVLVNFVLGELQSKGLVRAFIETNVTNAREIRSLAKTDFQKFGLGRKYHIGERSLVIWSKVR